MTGQTILQVGDMWVTAMEVVFIPEIQLMVQGYMETLASEPDGLLPQQVRTTSRTVLGTPGTIPMAQRLEELGRLLLAAGLLEAVPELRWEAAEVMLEAARVWAEEDKVRIS